MHDLPGIIGAISGCISLMGIVYLAGIWRGEVNSALKEQAKNSEQYPPAEMWTMVKTLWDIYVVSALHHRPDLAEHGSGYKLKADGEDLIPDHMKVLLKRIPRVADNHNDVATGYLVVKNIGMDLINEMAEQKELSVQETIAIMSCWLDVHSNNVHPPA